MTKEEIKNTAKKQSEDLKFILESDARFYYESFICGAEWYKEYADQQTKALTDEIDQLNKDYSILNDQFVKSKEWNLEIVYSNKFKDKEIKQLQARIDELEKALKESVIVLNGVDFSLFYKDEEEKANKLINKIYQLTEPTNK